MEMMDMAADDTREELRRKLRSNFDGRIVRKDLTKKIKEGANVPVYVLEFLLGQYCSSDDETIIEQGVQNVKRILADNFVRPDEAQKILSQLRKNGHHTIIDMVTVHLDIKKDCFFAEFSNLGLTNVPITDDYPEKYDRLLCGGIWCIVQLEYESEGDSSFGITDIDGQPISSKQKKQKDISPISIHKLTPIQMPHVDIEEVREGRKAFTQEEWMDVMLRSCGYEPEQLNNREKWLLLARMLPLVENNFNLCELGPRSTGKSHIYKEISPNSILVSGGQTTVANLFYNMGRKTVGLVGLWDCVAFDEVAGIKFKKKPRPLLWSSSATSIRAWMCCLRLPLCLTRSRRRWERTPPFLTVCIATFQAGRFRSSVRSILPMITALSRITWQSLSENCGKNSMVMRWISISALERT